MYLVFVSMTIGFVFDGSKHDDVFTEKFQNFMQLTNSLFYKHFPLCLLLLLLSNDARKLKC